ncbi:MAG: septum formation protein Maf [Chloroflexi bacterium]|nr:septum formation protein Maf [Chloroflexota bacterium]
MARLILASASPRRKELLERLGVRFDVRPVEVTEDAGLSKGAQIVARRLARAKAEAARLEDERAPILAADTVVALGGRIFGKPGDAGEVREMLRTLRGRTHEVVSAVVVMPLGRRSVIARQPLTQVTMREYGDDEIEASIAQGYPLDKAGAYGIQDELLRPVERYQGCYCNVIGLSLWAAIEALNKAGEEVDVGAASFLPQCATCPLAHL